MCCRISLKPDNGNKAKANREGLWTGVWPTFTALRSRNGQSRSGTSMKVRVWSSHILLIFVSRHLASGQRWIVGMIFVFIVRYLSDCLERNSNRLHCIDSKMCKKVLTLQSDVIHWWCNQNDFWELESCLHSHQCQYQHEKKISRGAESLIFGDESLMRKSVCAFLWFLL